MNVTIPTVLLMEAGVLPIIALWTSNRGNFHDID
jgi:hypothetical protein